MSTGGGVRPIDRRLGGAAGVGVGVGAAVVLVVVWVTAEPAVRTELAEPALLAALVAGVVGVVAAAVAARRSARHLGAARRLAEEVDLIASVDPSHRVAEPDAPEVAAVARAVNGLAGRYWESLSERDRAIAEGRRQADQDRERLVALMAELATGVLVCGADGRILLYNDRAARILSDADTDGVDPGPVGLGRSVFSALDRGALTNAVHRLELDSTSAEPVRLTTVGPGGQLLRTSVGPVRSTASTGLSGFVVMVEEASGEHQGREERDDLVRGLMEEARGRLAGITGAVQMLEEYDDLESADVDRFQHIIDEEAGRLTRYLAEVQRRHRQLTGLGWELTDVLVRDLWWALERRLEDGSGQVTGPMEGDGLWVRADAGGVIEALVDAVRALTGEGGAPDGTPPVLSFDATPRDEFVALTLTASCRRDPSGDDRPGLAERVDAAVTTGPLGTVARRHGGEAWWRPDAVTGPEVTVLLPRVEPVAAIAGAVPRDDRPTTYDFDLLASRPVGADRAAVRLDQLTCTVFDLETTGVEPTRGDRILSVGAVRIVNGRLLRHETFEALVDPGRRIPEPSTAIHGITDHLVAGQPPIEVVLPRFARFADQTVLVGHNVAFDMRFLELARPATGVDLDGPVLDTLLLAELAFGESDVHSLDWLADTLGVDMIGRHTALGDALVTAEVLIRLVPLLATKGLSTLGEVTGAVATTRYARLRY